MRNLLFIIGVLTPVAGVGQAAPPVAEVASRKPQGDPVTALCQGVDKVELALRTDEFILDAYDSDRQILAIQPRLDLSPRKRGGHPAQLNLPDDRRHLLMPLRPEEVMEAKEAWREGKLQLILSVKAVPKQVVGPQAGRCAPDEPLEVTVSAVRLCHGAWDLTKKQLDEEPAPARHHVLARSWVGHIVVEKGTPSPDIKALTEVVQPVAAGCLHRGLNSIPIIKGALTLELRRSPVGQPERPRVVVDSLVSQTIAECLVTTLLEAREVWPRMPQGGRVYVPFYFDGRSELSASTAAPDASSPPPGPSSSNAP